MTDAVGQQTPVSTSSEYNVYVFIIQQMLKKLQTATLVKVKAVTNSGADAAVGFVDVQPLVNQTAGTGESIEHKTIYNIPYFRMQGGANAVILDPQVDDIGIALFASRDISTVKKTKAAAPPASFRTFDWADGLYLGGVLNGVPTQFVQFNSSGITVSSPTKIVLAAPEIDINGSTAVKITTPTADIEASTKCTINSPANDIKGGGTKVDNKVFLTHDHTGVTTGGGVTGPVGP